MRSRYLLPVFIAVCWLGLMPMVAHAQSGAGAETRTEAATGAGPSPAAQPVADQAAALEERLIDLQVQIATVRSLARSVAPVAGGAEAARPFQAVLSDASSAQQIAALEGEMQSLAGQIKQLTGTPPLIMPTATRARAPAPDNGVPQSGQQLVARPAVGLQNGAQDAPQPAASGGWASSTTVTSGAELPRSNQPASSSVGEILPGTVYPGYKQAVPSQPAPAGNTVAGWAKPQPPSGVAPTQQVQGAGSPPAGAGDPKAEYQTAYGYLLQQDYGAAQTAFKEFIERHPKARLAANAQYWIGETYYVRGAYKNAAVAFLKGYETYGDGNKGPDSLLKLGMSLGKLRQTAAACSSLRELGSRYRNAPQATLARAKAEMSRLRCPR